MALGKINETVDDSKSSSLKLGHTSMQVGRQDKGNALQPVHHSDGLRLSGICDVDKLVWEVAVQVKIVAVVAPPVALHVTCVESEKEAPSVT